MKSAEVSIRSRDEQNFVLSNTISDNQHKVLCDFKSCVNGPAELQLSLESDVDYPISD
jgi:hypothetical protein